MDRIEGRRVSAHRAALALVARANTLVAQALALLTKVFDTQSFATSCLQKIPIGAPEPHHDSAILQSQGGGEMNGVVSSKRMPADKPCCTLDDRRSRLDDFHCREVAAQPAKEASHCLFIQLSFAPEPGKCGR